MEKLLDWLGLRSGVNKRLKAIETRLMKNEEAIAALEQAAKDQAEANVEVNAKFTELNARISELEEMIENQEVSPELVAKIAEVVTGAKTLAEVIPNPPQP